MRSLELSGKRFTRWLVICRAGSGPGGALWQCLCDCGTIRLVTATHLKRGLSRSCGCLQADVTAKRNKRHDMARWPEYGIWQNIVQRCSNTNNPSYNRYGGRGINMCDAWRDFATFIADVGRRPTPRHQLDRFPDNDGDYRPDNVRWTLAKQNSRNRRDNHRLEFNGKSLCISEWAELLGLTRSTLDRRLHLGWSVERALTTPVKRRNS